MVGSPDEINNINRAMIYIRNYDFNMSSDSFTFIKASKYFQAEEDGGYIYVQDEDEQVDQAAPAAAVAEATCSGSAFSRAWIASRTPSISVSTAFLST